MYQPEAVRAFYDSYGQREWRRLDSSAYSRLIYHNHMAFLQGYLKEGVRVLDAGCGGGRFSIPAAQAGCLVTCLDLSGEQVDIARQNMQDAGLMARAQGFVQADVADLRELTNESFDVVICFGAVLNYLGDRAGDAIRELARVARPGGTLFFSVNSLFGILRSTAANDGVGFWGRPDYWRIDEVTASGDLPGHEAIEHPPRHFYRAAEFRALLESCGLCNVALGAAPSILSGLRQQAEALEADPVAWAAVLRAEDAAFRLEHMADAGEFLLARGTVPD